MFAHLSQICRPKRAFALLMTLLLLLSSLGAAAQSASAQVISPDPFTIVVEKWVCPASVPLDAPIETFLKRCWPSTDTFDFALQSEAGTSRKSTAGGMVGWNGVPPGQVRIAERVPPAYGSTVIFCSYITQVEIDIPRFPGTFDPLPYNPKGVISPIGVFETRVVDISILYCQWFNILGNGQQG